MGSFFLRSSSSYLRARDQPKKDAGAEDILMAITLLLQLSQSELLAAM